MSARAASTMKCTRTKSVYCEINRFDYTFHNSRFYIFCPFQIFTELHSILEDFNFLHFPYLFSLFFLAFQNILTFKNMHTFHIIECRECNSSEQRTDKPKLRVIDRFDTSRIVFKLPPFPNRAASREDVPRVAPYFSGCI